MSVCLGRKLLVQEHLILLLIKVHSGVSLHKNGFISDEIILNLLGAVIVNMAFDPIFVLLVKDALIVRNPVLLVFKPVFFDFLLIFGDIGGDRLIVVAWGLVTGSSILISLIEVCTLVIIGAGGFKSPSLSLFSFFSCHA